MYIFNPEHDLCIANGNEHFVPPASALDFADDCRALTFWMQGLEPLADSPGQEEEIIPWGWNPVLRNRLLQSGFKESQVLSGQAVERIRQLSHRRWAKEALEAVRTALPDNVWPRPVEQLYDLKSIVERVEGSPGERRVLKAPWSGSGRGLRWVDDSLSAGDARWCARVLEKQGSVMMERRYGVVQDCAMLFYCGSRSLRFAGYSLFYTRNGVYRANCMAPDGEIENFLSQYIPVRTLHEVRQALADFLEAHFVGGYRGYIGIDQFVYDAADPAVAAGRVRRFHPAVEINPRMTMGLIARHLCDRWGMKDACLQVLYDRDNARLRRRCETAFSLCPLSDKTHYALIVEPFSLSGSQI